LPPTLESSALSDEDPLFVKAHDHVPTKDEEGSSVDDGLSTKPKTKKPARKYKKAPGAPKRFRSAFILFSQYKHKAIQESLASEGTSQKTTSVAKLVSEQWRTLDAEERSRWEAKARMDRERFEKEKAKYRGPWTVPIGHRRSKDPTAPKRPASAFLSFSNSRRAAAKQENKEASNAEISKILSHMWKAAPDDLKKEYTDKEAIAREEYKKKIAAWRVEHEKNKKKEKDPLELYQEKQEERKRKGIASDEDEDDDDDSFGFSVDGRERKRSITTSSPMTNPFTGRAAGMGVGGLNANDLTQMILTHEFEFFS
ncbi:MAG: hypothetical protein SGILL_007566, partial [Bacillariaceae sp.]